MARKYATSKRGKMVTIHGFEEMAEMLQELERRGVDRATEKIFDECCGTIKESIDKFARQSIPDDLAAKTSQFKVRNGNAFMYAYGWDRNKNLDDFLKVCYLNYGTPRRFTKESGQRVLMGSGWATLGTARGKIEPRGFIANGKRSAAQKINARKRTMLKEILDGGRK